MRLLLAALLAFSAGCGSLPPDGGIERPIRETSREADHTQATIAASDGTLLYVQAWRPRAAAQAALVVVHGLRDHSSRYAELGKELAKRGWVVYAFDLRGHGRSQGPRALVERFDRLVFDLATVMEEVRGREPDLPVFLMGHSMGGAVAAIYAQTQPPPRIDGLILSAPALGALVSQGAACGANVLTDFAPNAPALELDLATWSTDARVLEDNRRDPLVYQRPAPVITGASLIEGAEQALAEAPYLRLPLLVLHGEGDEITHAEQSRRFVERTRSSDKELRTYPGLFHDLWHEPDHRPVMEDLTRWLERHDKDPDRDGIDPVESDEGEVYSTP